MSAAAPTHQRRARTLARANPAAAAQQHRDHGLSPTAAPAQHGPPHHPGCAAPGGLSSAQPRREKPRRGVRPCPAAAPSGPRIPPSAEPRGSPAPPPEGPRTERPQLQAYPPPPPPGPPHLLSKAAAPLSGAAARRPYSEGGASTSGAGHAGSCSPSPRQPAGRGPGPSAPGGLPEGARPGPAAPPPPPHRGVAPGPYRQGRAGAGKRAVSAEGVDYSSQCAPRRRTTPPRVPRGGRAGAGRGAGAVRAAGSGAGRALLFEGGGRRAARPAAPPDPPRRPLPLGNRWRGCAR